MVVFEGVVDLEALPRFSAALKRFATAKEAAGKYHETITVAFMLLIADRLHRNRGTNWSQFAAANPDLFAHPSPLATFYSDTLLTSDRARETFLFPDKPSAGPSAGVQV